jgi:hypothetical protein
MQSKSIVQIFAATQAAKKQKFQDVIPAIDRPQCACYAPVAVKYLRAHLFVCVAVTILNH